MDNVRAEETNMNRRSTNLEHLDKGNAQIQVDEITANQAAAVEKANRHDRS